MYMNQYYLKYLKYKNNKFILNGGMKQIEFELHGTTLTVDIPNNFLCPIIHKIIEDPVITCDGYSYERNAIIQWFTHSHTNPLTNVPLLNINLIPNHSLKGAITDFKESIYTKKILELTQLAQQNNSNAKYELGVMYSKYPDIEKSMHWLNKAVEQHHEQAQHEIIQINERLERERPEKERLERERLERERLERERLERERLERLERERLERERLERERLERERLERLERERFDREYQEIMELRERGRRERLERLEAIRLEKRERGIIDTITEKEKRKLLLRAYNYQDIKELFAKYGPIIDVVFNILISGRSKSYYLLHQLLINYPELITEENFIKIIALDPPLTSDRPDGHINEHLITPHNPLYKPRDRELIIQELINRYPRLVTENSKLILRQYITQELHHIHTIRNFYVQNNLDDNREVMTKIYDLNTKERNLLSIRDQLTRNF